MKRLALSAVAVAVLALALWLALVDTAPSEDGASARPRADASAAAEAQTPLPSAQPESLSASDPRAAFDAPDRAATPLTTLPAPSTDGPRGKLIVRVSNAAGGPAPREVTASLQLPSGVRRVRSDPPSSRLEFDEIELGEWPIALRAAGFHDLDALAVVRGLEPTELTLELWPLDWIVLRAVTEHGEPYTEIARRLGLGPAALFEQGFQVWTSIDAPSDPLNWPATAPLTPGTAFSLVSHRYDREGFDLRDLARAKRPSRGPVWVALAFHRRFFGWAQLPANVNVAQFEVAAEDFTDPFGSLAFRIVDPASGAPLVDARASLDAEVAGLRRPDTSNFGPDELGVFSAKPLLPGEYDLTIHAPLRGEHHQRVRIQPGERLDLGELALDFAEQLQIRVFDESGQPTLARVQLGQWRAGAWIEECVTPRAWVTGDGGRVSVPMPSGKIVLRAQRMSFNSGGGLGPEPFGAAFADFDPDSRATQLELRFAVVRRVELVPPPADGVATHLRVLTDFEIGVAQESLDTERRLDFALAPGRYTAALLDRSENVLARYPFEVTTILIEPIVLQ